MYMKPHVTIATAALLAALHLSAAAASDDIQWPQFRGPGARGVGSNANLPDHWSTTENVAWKTDIPGRGWSSPIVWGNRVFLTTVVNLGESEAPTKGLYRGGDRDKIVAAEHQWKVLCLDLLSGKLLWERLVYRGEPSQPIHIKNSYASETPVTDGERLYVCFGNVGLFCFDLDGRELWSKPIKPHTTFAGWGTAASPVLHGDRLYFIYDNQEQSYLLALDKRSGEQVWRIDRDEKSNWSTPYIWQNAQRTEIVTPGSGKTRSYDLDGKLLWWFKGMSGITIATPYAGDDLLYISSGFVGSKLRPLYAIRPGGSDDISLAAGETSNASIAWCHRTAGPYNPTTLLYDGRIYVLQDRGTLSAFNAKTGEIFYDCQTLPEGEHFTTSPWAYNGRIFCLNEDGLTFVLRAGDKFELLHTNKLAEDDMGMASPAMVGDRLVLRTAARVYCVRNMTAAP
jgi:outer membrane protein assembly factor BamB